MQHSIFNDSYYGSHYIPRSHLFNNWKFLPFDPLHPFFSHFPLPASGNRQSVLFLTLVWFSFYIVLCVFLLLLPLFLLSDPKNHHQAQCQGAYCPCCIAMNLPLSTALLSPRGFGLLFLFVCLFIHIFWFLFWFLLRFVGYSAAYCSASIWSLSIKGSDWVQVSWVLGSK